MLAVKIPFMKLTLVLTFILLILFSGLIYQKNPSQSQPQVLSAKSEKTYWFMLLRKSNREFLYQGEPGNKQNSQLVKIFQVKTGIPGKRPTPLPELFGREYWLIIDKTATPDNPETSPYFLTLDIPVTNQEPYGPTPYEECNGQCNWILPGAFGLHGTGENLEKLATTDPGSSGCIRHYNDDITYIYNLLDPQIGPVRYYVKDL